MATLDPTDSTADLHAPAVTGGLQQRLSDPPPTRSLPPQSVPPSDTGTDDLPAAPEPGSPHDEPLDADERLMRAHEWGLGTGQQNARRVTAVRKAIDDGLMDLHPEFLGWLRYVLNWEQVHSQLPRLSKSGKHLHRGSKQRIGAYRALCLDLLVPTPVLLQQVMNYRLTLGRTLPATPTATNPVSTGTGMTDGGTREYVTMIHTFLHDDGLLTTLRTAHDQLRAYREKERGWEPLHDLVVRDGVEDGGLWLQTVFAPLGTDGQPDLTAAQASLAPADAASRKAVCDSVIDPSGALAALPLLAPRRRDVYGAGTPNPLEPIEVAAAVGALLGRVKAALSASGASFVDELDSEDLALFHCAVMPVRLVYAVEDNRGQRVHLPTPTLFRLIQGHYHGLDHLRHPESETERLEADKVREALHTSIDDGTFSADPATGLNAAGIAVGTAWTHELINTLSGSGDYTPLTSLNLPANRHGAAVAAAMLTYGTGPERAVIGQALGSKRKGGTYDDMQLGRREALLRELIFADRADVNRRAFQHITTRDLWEAAPTGWDGDTDALVDRVAAGTTKAETALFELLAVASAAEYGFNLVDVGSAGIARGFASVKALHAVAGLSVIVDKDTATRRHAKHPGGAAAVKALLGSRLLLTPPMPIEGLDAPTETQWTQWAAGGLGAFDDDGNPLMVDVRAVAVDDTGAPLTEQGALVHRLLSMPQPAPPTVLDAFSRQRLEARAKADYATSPSGTPAPRPPLASEIVDDALVMASTSLSRLDEAVTKIDAETGKGYLLTDVQVSQLDAIALTVRVNATSAKGAGPRLDDIKIRNGTKIAGVVMQQQAGQDTDVAEDDDTDMDEEFHVDGKDDGGSG